MFPSHRQSAISTTSWLRGEDPFWIDRDTCAALHQETLRLFEGLSVSLERPTTPSTYYPLPSSDGFHFGPPPTPEYTERVCDADFTLDASNTPLHIKYDNPFGQEEPGTSAPSQTVVSSEHPSRLPTPCDDSDASIAYAHFLPAPIDPSAMMAYTLPFDPNCGSLTPSTPEHTNLSSSSTSPPASSSRSNSSDYDEEYCPTRAISLRSKRKNAVRTKPTPRRAFPSPTPSSESGGSIATSSSRKRARPYTRPAAPRNFQSKDGAESTDGLSELRCPVPGCRTKPQRISDLRRHIESHNYWRDPDRWICCGVGTEDAPHHGMEIPQDATREELIKAGAYTFEGRLMVGGCMRKFTRRDALKRHVDNPMILCIGDMDSYPR